MLALQPSDTLTLLKHFQNPNPETYSFCITLSQHSVRPLSNTEQQQTASSLTKGSP
jgi:hypothetical protein